jgi:hypothetical protein
MQMSDKYNANGSDHARFFFHGISASGLILYEYECICGVTIYGVRIPMFEEEDTYAGPDWKRYVRDQLPQLAIDPGRELEIIEELAEHLAAVYQDALAKGASEKEAYEAAATLFADWRLLECELAVAERDGKSTSAARWARPVRCV